VSSLRSNLIKVTAMGALGAIASTAHAAGVPAGTTINNTAEVTYNVGSVPTTTTSNTASVTVAEILNVVVTAQTPSVAVAAGNTQQVLVFLVTNTGNGPEALRLNLNSVIGGDQFDPTPSANSIYLDNDRNGVISAGDTAYVVGTDTPVLAADGDLMVLLVNDIPTTVVDTNLGFSRLTADARTGTGAPGTTFAAQGQGGTDAVVGTTGADGDAQAQYLVAGVTVNALKSQTVADQFGGNRPIPGATINYTIVVSATGSGSATGMVFNDNIPANTTYTAGTLRLNGTLLSDGVDPDAGVFENAPTPRVRVALGTLTQASGSQTITFAVRID
jgi:uncharacterized repeat protein (TIGR01451 family)